MKKPCLIFFSLIAIALGGARAMEILTEMKQKSSSSLDLPRFHRGKI
jgi:hypothetical protein